MFKIKFNDYKISLNCDYFFYFRARDNQMEIHNTQDRPPDSADEISTHPQNTSPAASLVPTSTPRSRRKSPLNSSPPPPSAPPSAPTAPPEQTDQNLFESDGEFQNYPQNNEQNQNQHQNQFQYQFTSQSTQSLSDFDPATMSSPKFPNSPKVRREFYSQTNSDDEDDEDDLSMNFFYPEVTQAEREKYPQSSMQQKTFRKNVNLQEELLETGVTKISADSLQMVSSDEDQDRLSSSNFTDLLLELCGKRQIYKHDIERLATLRMQSHENFQQLFEDKLEYRVILQKCHGNRRKWLKKIKN